MKKKSVKKDILKLFYLPMIGWVVFSVFYFLLVYFFVNNYINQQAKHTRNILLNEKKLSVKKNIKDIKTFFLKFEENVYDYTNILLNKSINLIMKNDIKKIINNDTAIMGLIPKNKKFKFYFFKNKYIILKYDNKNYLVVLKRKNKKEYLLGVRKKFIDTFILDKIKRYLDSINKNRLNDIELEKITTLTPNKNGYFGYVFYMPHKLKNLEGLILSVKKPDMKGNYFRNKYLKCFKQHRGCFVSYYEKNPFTKKIEKKYTYFDYYPEYNLGIVKGFYESKFRKLLNDTIKKRKKSSFEIFEITALIYFGFLFIFILIQHLIMSKIKLKLIVNYNTLENNLIKSLYYDSLTELPNRNKLIRDIAKYKSLILIDIDDFSTINEVFGFDAGDDILKKLARMLKNKFKNVYRIGSDEFAVGLCETITQNRLSEFSNKEIKINDLKIDVIIGASNYKKRLYESAEMALKIVSKSKNKKYLLYDNNIFNIQKEKLNKINLLKEVMIKKDIIPYYQCIVDKNGKITKYEALMRIKINEKIKSPFFFMDLIKEARLYNSFSKIMIEKVLKDVEKMNMKVSINLSYDDISNSEMRSFILNSLDKTNASKIVFEILESESIQNYDIVKEFLFNIKEKGAEVAIDDFGSGYSNFVQVLNLQPDIIKIDASLIKNIKEAKNYKMVELMVDFAKSFNLKTVAEFVSSKEIFETVKDLGIDEFQGFYFCEPLSFDKISSKKGNNEN